MTVGLPMYQGEEDRMLNMEEREEIVFEKR